MIRHSKWLPEGTKEPGWRLYIRTKGGTPGGHYTFRYRWLFWDWAVCVILIMFPYAKVPWR